MIDPGKKALSAVRGFSGRVLAYLGSGRQISAPTYLNPGFFFLLSLVAKREIWGKEKGTKYDGQRGARCQLWKAPYIFPWRLWLEGYSIELPAGTEARRHHHRLDGRRERAASCVPIFGFFPGSKAFSGAQQSSYDQDDIFKSNSIDMATTSLER